MNVPEDGFAVFTNVLLMSKPKSAASAAWLVDTYSTQGSRRIVALNPATP